MTDTSKAQGILCNVRNYLSGRQGEAASNEEFIGLCEAQRMIHKRFQILARQRAREIESANQ